MRAEYSVYTKLKQIALKHWSSNPRCVICGIGINEDDNHSEHVPPKGIFVGNISDELLTVPCCRNCNNGTSINDREFKYYLAHYCGVFAKGKTASSNELHSALKAKMNEDGTNNLPEKIINQISRSNEMSSEEWWTQNSHDVVIFKIICGLFWLNRGGEVFTDRGYSVIIARAIDFSEENANQQIGMSYPGISIGGGQFLAHHMQNFDSADSIYSGIFELSLHFHCDLSTENGYHVLAYCFPEELIESNSDVNEWVSKMMKMETKPGKVSKYVFSAGEISNIIDTLKS